MDDINGAIESYETGVIFNCNLIYGKPSSWNHFDEGLVRNLAFLGYWYDILNMESELANAVKLFKQIQEDVNPVEDIKEFLTKNDRSE